MTLDPYSPLGHKFAMVVDADALLPSIDNHCRTHRPSRMLRIADSSAAATNGGARGRPALF
jgi:hypothetical protein